MRDPTVGDFRFTQNSRGAASFSFGNASSRFGTRPRCITAHCIQPLQIQLNLDQAPKPPKTGTRFVFQNVVPIQASETSLAKQVFLVPFCSKNVKDSSPTQQAHELCIWHHPCHGMFPATAHTSTGKKEASMAAGGMGGSGTCWRGWKATMETATCWQTYSNIYIYIHMLAPYKTNKTYLFLYGRNVLGSSFPEQSKYCYTVSSVHLYIFCKHWCVLTMNSACLNTKSFPQMLYTFLRWTVPLEKRLLSPKECYCTYWKGMHVPKGHCILWINLNKCIFVERNCSCQSDLSYQNDATFKGFLLFLNNL